MPINADKALIRTATLARRAAVPSALRQSFGSGLVESGLALIGPTTTPAATTVSLYRPIRDEADTTPLLIALWRAGFVTALPLARGRGTPLAFHRWQPGDPLATGAWGIPEPLESAPLVEPDILFVPLAAFDRRGFRLGYGAGFYDNALLTLRRMKLVLAIGVAFKVQEVDDVPREPHDQRLDAIVTEDETIVPGAL